MQEPLKPQVVAAISAAVSAWLLAHGLDPARWVVRDVERGETEHD